MIVKHLFIKTDNDFTEVSNISLIKHKGIMHDKNLNDANPRQILICSMPIIKKYNLSIKDLKANIIVDENIEDYSSGQVLKIGNSLIALTFKCEPCYKLDEVQKGLSKKIVGERGFLAVALESGNINQNDNIILTDFKSKYYSDIAIERFADLINSVPKGYVIKTSDIILALGVSKGYYRALPGYIKKYIGVLPVHRIVNVNKGLMESHIPNQKELLLSEHIKINNNVVDDKYIWKDFCNESFIYK